MVQDTVIVKTKIKFYMEPLGLSYNLEWPFKVMSAIRLRQTSRNHSGVATKRQNLSSFLARDSIKHICSARYILSPVRTSVCPSVTRVLSVKTFEVRIVKFSPYGRHIFLIFAFSSEILTPPIGGDKQGRGEKTSHFLGLNVNENGRRYVQSHYWWLKGRRTCAFNWHQDRWPWMTLNCYSSNSIGI